jgi:hypothetical protein
MSGYTSEIEMKTKVTAHIHDRVFSLIQEAIDKGVIQECEPTKDIAILANQSGRTANQVSSNRMRVNSKKQNAEKIQIRPIRILRA